MEQAATQVRATPGYPFEALLTPHILACECAMLIKAPQNSVTVEIGVYPFRSQTLVMSVQYRGKLIRTHIPSKSLALKLNPFSDRYLRPIMDAIVL